MGLTPAVLNCWLKGSGADSMGHGEGTCPHFYKCVDTGGTVDRRTANKKLTKLYRPSRKRSSKNDWLYF